MHIELEPLDPISSELMSTQISTIYSLQSMIKYDEDTDEFSSVAAINTSKSDAMTPEELSCRLCIGLKTAARTLKATSHQYIRTTGLLSKRFRTDKAQLRYK